MIRLIQISKRYDGYSLNDIYVNPRHIIYMTESHTEKQLFAEGKIQLDFDKNVNFTKIKINENDHVSEIVVVGEPSTIENKIFKSKNKTLLRG